MKWKSDNMMNVTDILREAWRNIKFYEKGSLQLGINHPLELHVAYETPTNKALVIIASIPIDTLDSSKSITTVCQKREDGKYYISFRLIENSQEEVFINMCSNLIEYSADALTEKDALKRVSMRFRQWRRLMEYQNQSILSDEKRRGLIGELLYFRSMISDSKPVSEALDGWVGPDGADQDFVYSEKWREIKTTGISSDQISIHSIEQLGMKNETGELHIYRVDPCAPESEGAFTLRSLVKEISKLFDGDLDLLERFYNKLSSVGYIDLPVYDNYSYKFSRKDIYDVIDSFPRITRTDIPSEIIKVEYVLSISSIEDWKRG